MSHSLRSQRSERAFKPGCQAQVFGSGSLESGVPKDSEARSGPSQRQTEPRSVSDMWLSQELRRSGAPLCNPM